MVTDRPMRAVLYSRDIIGRISQWAVELIQYQIEFVPQKDIKAQVLANFITEWTDTSTVAEDNLNDY